MTAWIWMLLGVAGLVALAAGMYYGQYKTTHPPHTRKEDLRRDRATHKIYEEIEKERSARSH